MSQFYSPLRYPGGKSRIYKFVSNVLLENNLIGINYAEPYAGGAGLALKLLISEYVGNIYINDLDKSIYSFWKSILGRPTEFCDWIEGVKVNVENWQHFKQIQENSENYDEFELAKSTFFLNRTNVSGVIKGGIIGGLDQKGKYKIDARFNKKRLIKRIEKISEFGSRINVSRKDGINFIKKMDRMESDVFVYLDPPYYEKASDLYMNYYSKKDHKKLSKYVQRMQKRWLVSYDNHEFILHLYDENEKLTYKLSHSTSNRIGDEVLVFSDRLKFQNSLSQLKSPILLK
jgi:DNA adenine methylase